ncbi:hypothetical protein WICPIJ_003509 [Wickerhamomyces pijperi]|uniref:Smr domain-containing protein n=1 Tax=Wickerhamomyces pijperi TaxID=599730 RepID=A0A9P8Q9F8_WICPI|nr:hypothetical protein WICPIJ_003509 [Wickerhamomyces pijperi]
MSVCTQNKKQISFSTAVKDAVSTKPEYISIKCKARILKTCFNIKLEDAEEMLVLSDEDIIAAAVDITLLSAGSFDSAKTYKQAVESQSVSEYSTVSSEQAKSIVDALEQDKSLQQIQWWFWIASMTCFKGKLSEAIDLAKLCISETPVEKRSSTGFADIFCEVNEVFNKIRKQFNNNKPFSTSSKSSPKRSPKSTTKSTSKSSPTSSSNSSRRSSCSSSFHSEHSTPEEQKKPFFKDEIVFCKTSNRAINNRQIVFQTNIVSNALTLTVHKSELDLHKNTLRTIADITRDALPKWWEMEVEERIEKGIVDCGPKARHVAPLRIITGRGIHSSDGFCKTKELVMSLLKKEGWIFTEGLGDVKVCGYRRQN